VISSTLVKPLLLRAAMLAVQPFYGGIGAIHMLHRVVPDPERSRFGDNRALEITPGDLDTILQWMKERSYDFITLDELPGRLQKPTGRKFACFTLDDGCRDNRLHALPVFEKHGVPFAVNITTAFTDHTAIVWWYALEDLLGAKEHFAFRHGGQSREFALGTLTEKVAAFETIAQLIRGCDLAQHGELLAVLFEGAPFDPLQRTRDLILGWDEVAEMDAHPLVTIGAHGIHHLTSCNLDTTALRHELAGSKKILEERLNHPVRHLAFPFGGARAVGKREFLCASECGFTTALTTRAANLFPDHATALDRLPRISVSGNYPVLSCLERLESGLDCARANRWKRVVTE
jgi:peptidoglycan/xylan/chitin deacetylase (PgdA/CDA1 family)